MKNIFFLILILLTTSICKAQEPVVQYDGQLAASLGADDYGMKSYIFVMLKTGTASIENKVLRDSLFSGHLQNIGRLVKEGKLIVAGPFGKNEHDYRGIFILDVKTITEATELLKTDPAIEAKLLKAEVIEWYGSAALPSYLNVHQKIEKSRP